MNLVFMGSPQFAVPALERLLERDHRVVAVYTQPDRPKGRGGRMSFSPVKETALRHGLPVQQPERVRRPEVVDQLRSLNPEAIAVVGYGQIIPQSIIDIPRHGIVNVHASLLPGYRGAAPIQWAIANGETRTGVTTMMIDAGLDTGDMLLKWETRIGPEEDAIGLGARMSEAGADLLIETMAGIESGGIRREPQNHSKATYAPMLKKQDGQIRWDLPARDILNRMRGFVPWPGTYTHFRGQLFHVWKARPSVERGQSGVLEKRGRSLIVGCGEGTAIELLEIQLEGRKRMDPAAFANGNPISAPERLGESHN